MYCSGPLHETLALYLSIVIKQHLPSIKILNFGSFYKGGYVDVEGIETIAPSLLDELSHAFSNFVQEHVEVPVIEMVPMSAKALWMKRTPNKKIPFDTNIPNQLVRFIQIDEALHFFPDEDYLENLSGVRVKLLDPQKLEASVLRFTLVGGDSIKELTASKAYFPYSAKKDYRSIGESMQLWAESSMCLAPKGYQLYSITKRLIEDASSPEFHFNYHASAKLALQNHLNLPGEPAVSGLYAWKEFAREKKEENFYFPLKSTAGYGHLVSQDDYALNVLISSLQFNCRMIKIFGFSSKFYLRLSKKRRRKGHRFYQDGSLFEAALKESGCEFEKKELNFGSSPRIEIYFADHLGREWPMGCLKRCSEFQDEEVSIFEHQLIHGLEMILNLSIESTKGVLPGYLAPEQVRIIPVAEKQLKVAEEILYQLRLNGIQAKVDLNFQRLQNRIFTAEKNCVPYFALIGEREEAKGLLAVRPRKGKKTLYLSVEELAEMLKKEKDYFRQ